MRDHQGITLMEIVLSSVLALILVMGLSAVDGTRVRISADLRQRGGLNTDQPLASLAALHLTRRIELADRANIIQSANPGSLQLRVFQPDTDCPALGPGCAAVCTGCTGGGIPSVCCYDIAANYAWDQYRLSGAQLLYFAGTEAGCPTAQVLSGQISSLTFNFTDRAGAPPGGDPGANFPNNADTNMIAFDFLWRLGAAQQRFRGEVSMRAEAYTNLGASGSGAGRGDSGWGLAPAAASPPPGAC